MSFISAREEKSAEPGHVEMCTKQKWANANPHPRPPPASGVNQDEGRLLSDIGRGGKPVLLQ